MTLELETTRGIAAQVLRHRSFTYQEFSQRYADSSMLADRIPMFDLRSQDEKNRQNSIDDVDPFTKQHFEILIQKHFAEAMDLYQQMLAKGIAKECSRFVLPLAVPTKIYMTDRAGRGSIISICVLLTVLRKSIWIWQSLARKYLLSSFRSVRRHLNGHKNL